MAVSWKYDDLLNLNLIVKIISNLSYLNLYNLLLNLFVGSLFNMLSTGTIS